MQSPPWQPLETSASGVWCSRRPFLLSRAQHELSCTRTHSTPPPPPPPPFQGANILLERGNGAEARAAVMEVVRHHFRPEFLNRVDESVQVGRTVYHCAVKACLLTAPCWGAAWLSAKWLHVLCATHSD